MKKIIYGKETSSGELGESLVSFDDTDHFDFICSDCKVGLDIEKVVGNDAEAEDADTILYFYCKCLECMKVSQRKIRINDQSRRRYLGMYTIKDCQIVNLGSLHYLNKQDSEPN